MSEDTVSGAEFGRFRNDFSAFQDRLQRQIDTGFGGVHGRLDELNGRTRKNSEAIAVIDSRIATLEKDENEVGVVVTNIRDHGCSQIENHSNVLRALSGDGAEEAVRLSAFWTKKRKAAVAGGLVASGGVLGAIVLELLRSARETLQLFHAAPK